MIIFGIDSAPTRTGVCWLVLQDGVPNVVCTAVVVRDGKDADSLISYIDCILTSAGVETRPVDLVVLEDYTRQITSMVSFDAGEVGGVLRYVIRKDGAALLVVPPSILRSFIADGRSLPRKLATTRVFDMQSRRYVSVAVLCGKPAMTRYVRKDFNPPLRASNARDLSDLADAVALTYFGVMWVDLLHGQTDRWSRKRASLVAKVSLEGELPDG